MVSVFLIVVELFVMAAVNNSVAINVDESGDALHISPPAPVYCIVIVDNTPFGQNEVPIPTFYDTLTTDEINHLEVVIQHEVGNFSTEYKRLVAELIYNRIKSERFPNTVKGVLYQENQFCGIERWYYPEFPVDEETKKVVQEVFSQDETTHSAVFYYNPALSEPSSVIWFEYSGDISFLFEYSEVSWGIEYTTRFFE